MIPPFLDTIFIELEKRGFKRVGIFRISASFDKIEELKIKIDKEENINYSELDEILLSCILKLFLREIPEPLFTLQYYGEWLSLLNIPEEKRLETAKDLFSKLPHENCALIKRVLDMCYKISLNHQVNKMNVSNLSIVLTPNLLHEGDQFNISNIPHENKTFAYLIENYPKLFDEPLSVLINTITPGPNEIKSNETKSMSTPSTPNLEKMV